MNKRPKSTKKTDIKMAMAALEQAFEYYTPLPQTPNTAPYYDDMPFGQ